MISKTLDFIIEYTTVKKEMDINKEPSCKVSESNLWFYTEDSGNTFQNSTFEYDNEMDTDEGVSKNREMDNEDAKQTHMYSVNNNDGNETSDAQEENQDNKKGTFKQLLKDKESRRKVFRTFFMLCLYPIFVSTIVNHSMNFKWL